jgi:hypothetical protein
LSRGFRGLVDREEINPVYIDREEGAGLIGVFDRVDFFRVNRTQVAQLASAARLADNCGRDAQLASRWVVWALG